MNTASKEFVSQLPKDLIKGARHHIGPTNTLILGITGLFAMGVLLRPDPVDFIFMLLADLLAGLIYFQLDPYIFRKLRPAHAKIFEGLSTEDFIHASSEDRTKLISKIIQFPRLRANYNARISVFKVIPAAVVGIFFTDSLGSPEARAVVVIPAILLNLSFFYISNYYDYHRYLSYVLNSFHKEINLTESFKNVEFDTERTHFSYIHGVGLGLMVSFSVCLNFLINYNEPTKDPLIRSLFSCIISLVGIVVFMRAWYMTKALTLEPMWDVVNELSHVNLGEPPKLLNIHTVPLISRVQQTILGMKVRLKQSEDELSEYIHQEAEQERYRILGEITALIAHDLSSPLHAASFFTNELRSGESPPQVTMNYLDRIHNNLDRATTLLHSMRFRLKEDDEGIRAISLTETHNEVVRFLSMQYASETFSRIKVEIDDPDQLSFAISNVDFAQVLDNLYRNAINEFLSAHTPAPRIRVWVQKDSGGKGNIFISDNGRGMSAERFEQLTHGFSKNNRSLGLKLCRRLIEKHGGTLTLLSDSTRSGATFVIGLPLYETLKVKSKSTILNLNTRKKHEANSYLRR